MPKATDRKDSVVDNVHLSGRPVSAAGRIRPSMSKLGQLVRNRERLTEPKTRKRSPPAPGNLPPDEPPIPSIPEKYRSKTVHAKGRNETEDRPSFQPPTPSRLRTDDVSLTSSIEFTNRGSVQSTLDSPDILRPEYVTYVLDGGDPQLDPTAKAITDVSSAALPSSGSTRSSSCASTSIPKSHNIQ